MKQNQNITGYPHLDRPWLQYYEETNQNIVLPELNLVDYLKEKNKNRENLISQVYYGKETSFQEMFENSSLAAKILSQYGVKKGDRILNLNPNIPETSYIWFGATELGAITDFADPRPDSMDLVANGKKLLEIIKYEKINHLVVLDKCYLAMIRPIEEELIEFGIDKIILTNAKDSMTIKGQIDYLKDVVNYNMIKNNNNISNQIKKLKDYEALLLKIKTMKEEDLLLNKAIETSKLKVYKYSDLAKQCNYVTYEKKGKFNDDNYIGHTSGTSGSRPKPILLTNKNSISTIEQVYAAKVCADIGDKSLHVLPFFAPFGAYDNYLLNLRGGIGNISVPEFDISEFGYLLKKHKPNVIMATPAWIAALPQYDYLQDEDFSSLKRIIYGGDAMSKKDEEKVNKWLKEHGCNAEITKGYGMSEFCGCGTYARGEYNKPDSIGIPLPDTTCAIVDPNVEDKLVPLKFEEGKDRLTGELAVSSDTVTKGILDGNIIVPHFELDSKSYIRTRDLVEIDRNGIIYHQARKDRSFTRFDGYKIKPYEIESIIKENEQVINAIIVEYYDERQRGIMPICHISINEELTNDEKVSLVKDIVYNQIIANPTTSSRQIPAKFKIRHILPLTKNGKVDFNYLRQEPLDGTEINVDVNQTNLSVEDINIYIDKKNKIKNRIK